MTAPRYENMIIHRSQGNMSQEERKVRLNWHARSWSVRSRAEFYIRRLSHNITSIRRHSGDHANKNGARVENQMALWMMKRHLVEAKEHYEQLGRYLKGIEKSVEVLEKELTEAGFPPSE